MLYSVGLGLNGVRNGPAWYIGVLFWASLFYLALLKSLKQETRNFLISIIVFFSYAIVVKENANLSKFAFEILPIGFLRGIAGMGLGIMIAQVCKRNDSTNHQVTAKFTLVEFILLIYLTLGLFIKDAHISYWIFRPATLACLLILFIIKKGHISHWLEQSWLTKISRYCLSVFLTHNFFVALFMHCNPAKTWAHQNVALCIAICIVGSCLLGFISHHLIEKPCTNYLKKLFK